MKREIKIGKEYWVDIGGQVVRGQVVSKITTIFGRTKYKVVYANIGGSLMSKLLDESLIYKEYKGISFFKNN